MSANAFISPYLRRPCRSYQQVLHEQAERSKRAGQSESCHGSAAHEAAPESRVDADNDG